MNSLNLVNFSLILLVLFLEVSLLFVILISIKNIFKISAWIFGILVGLLKDFFGVENWFVEETVFTRREVQVLVRYVVLDFDLEVFLKFDWFVFLLLRLDVFF